MHVQYLHRLQFLSFTSYDYEALNTRKKIASFNNEEEYVEDLGKKRNQINIKKYNAKNMENMDEPVVEKLEIELIDFDIKGRNRIYFNPFMFERWYENPFKSEERLYPVDFGAPMTYTFVLNLAYPEDYKISELPKPTAISLPDNRGQYSFLVQDLNNRLSIRTVLKTSNIYSSEEYHALKELFARMVQINKMDIVFEKK